MGGGGGGGGWVTLLTLGWCQRESISNRCQWRPMVKDTAYNLAIGLIYGNVSWLDRGDGIDLWACAMGERDPEWPGSGRWIDSWGHATLAGSGWRECDLWGRAMGACDTGWTGAMGLIDGGAPCGTHDTDWNGAMALVYGDALWGRATGLGWWDWFVVAHHGGATVAGSGRWDWFMGRAMGARNWIGVMELICGGAPWGRTTLTRSGRWDWFMGARYTGWIGVMGLIHGGVPNDKVLYGCWS